MRLSRLLATLGIAVGAAFATYDESTNLLAACEPFGSDWYTRVGILVVIFLVHASVLAAGTLFILRFTGRRGGLVGSILEITITVAVTLGVGFGVVVADPLLSLGYTTACSLLNACLGSSAGSDVRAALAAAASWPNTPVAALLITCFGIGAFLLQGIMRRERASLGPTSEA